MKRETYKGRKLQTTKGTDYGYSRAKINGVDLGRHLGSEDAAMAWMKGQIDFIDQEDINGDRWAAEWYAPGTFELCENDHPKVIGGECLHSYCVSLRPAPVVETIAPELPAGTRVVCGDGKTRTVTGMTHRRNEPARVVVDGGTEWIAGECSPVPAPEAAAPYRAEYPVAGTSCTLVITDDEVQGHCADHGHLTTVKTSAYAFPGVHVERVARLHHNEEHDQD